VTRKDCAERVAVRSSWMSHSRNLAKKVPKLVHLRDVPVCSFVASCNRPAGRALHRRKAYIRWSQTQARPDRPHQEQSSPDAAGAESGLHGGPRPSTVAVRRPGKGSRVCYGQSIGRRFGLVRPNTHRRHVTKP
jgi:hypothetical protein